MIKNKKYNTKLKIKLEVLDNVPSKYPDTKNYIKENLMEVCEVRGNSFHWLPLSDFCL